MYLFTREANLSRIYPMTLHNHLLLDVMTVNGMGILKGQFIDLSTNQLVDQLIFHLIDFSIPCNLALCSMLIMYIDLYMMYSICIYASSNKQGEQAR